MCSGYAGHWISSNKPDRSVRVSLLRLRQQMLARVFENLRCQILGTREKCFQCNSVQERIFFRTITSLAGEAQVLQAVMMFREECSTEVTHV